MRIIFFILILIMISCNHQAQENSHSKSQMERKPDNVLIDKVADIAKGIDEKSATFIKNRLELLVGNYLNEKCKENNLTYPPKFILFRFFKYEKEFEVWAGNSRKDSLRCILLISVCAVDDQPGTKLQEGDGKTPEGFYNSIIAYGSNAAFMWIKLNNSDIDSYGTVGLGSSFKMCLDYPNSLDRLQTNTFMKHNKPGSAICIHGNCVSIGCISFENKNYLPVFLTALKHDNKNYGPLKIHIFPFRFDQVSVDKKQKFAQNVNHMTEKQVLDNWDNLEKAYTLFNKTRKVFNISISKDKYTYGNY